MIGLFILFSDHVSYEYREYERRGSLNIMHFSQTSYGTEREKENISAFFHVENPTRSKTYLRTVTAVVVETDQAPPAMVFLHAEQCQIPTAVLLTESYSFYGRKHINILIIVRKVDSSQTLPQKVHVYRACCEISIFLTCLRREAP
jgi:hypothetical protein